MPFTAEQFFDVLRRYNLAIWPGQLALGAIGLWLMSRMSQRRITSGAVGATLAALWAWMAIGYHVAFFSRINPMAFAFAVVFLAQAAAFLWVGVRTQRLAADVHPGTGRRAFALLAGLYALLGYPVLGTMLGQRYPELPTFGLPCPTTIFTLGMLSLCPRPVPWRLYVIPGVWALIATSAAWLFGIGEDLALVPALLASVALNAHHRTTLVRAHS